MTGFEKPANSIIIQHVDTHDVVYPGQVLDGMMISALYDGMNTEAILKEVTEVTGRLLTEREEIQFTNWIDETRLVVSSFAKLRHHDDGGGME